MLWVEFLPRKNSNGIIRQGRRIIPNRPGTGRNRPGMGRSRRRTADDAALPQNVAHGAFALPFT
jgi:hypothetical protein